MMIESDACTVNIGYENDDSIVMLQIVGSLAVGSAITNGREPKSFLARVFNFKLGSFTDNT
jgi:hypothetical protein